MTAAGNETWMVKCMVSDYNGLDATDGVLVRIGSGTGDYYAFILAGSDSPTTNFSAYRAIGGLLVIPVDPNENATYNDTVKDAGTPSLTAVDYFALVAAFSSPSAKNENVGLDAIDIGTGLYLVGGDGGDADGVWQDFVAAMLVTLMVAASSHTATGVSAPTMTRPPLLPCLWIPLLLSPGLTIWPPPGSLLLQ